MERYEESLLQTDMIIFSGARKEENNPATIGKTMKQPPFSSDNRTRDVDNHPVSHHRKHI